MHAYPNEWENYNIINVCVVISSLWVTAVVVCAASPPVLDMLSVLNCKYTQNVADGTPSLHNGILVNVETESGILWIINYFAFTKQKIIIIFMG
jgi:hypothetical protein